MESLTERIAAEKIKNFWIIDDDRIFGLISKRVIEISGIAESIKHITNAESAIQKIEQLAYSGKKLPEVIFLDINMPTMSGFDFLTRLEKIPQAYQTNVFIFSASITDEDREQTSNFSLVQGLVTKPLTIEKLDLIRSQL